MKWCRLPIGIEPIVSLGSLFVSLSYSISHVTIRLCWWTAQTTGKNPAKRAKFLRSLFCFPVGIDSVVLCGFKVGGFKKKNKGLRRHHGYFSGGKIICTHTTWQPPMIIQRWWHLPNESCLLIHSAAATNHMLTMYGPQQPNNSKYSDFQNAPCLTAADVSCVVVQLVVTGVTVASLWSPDSNQSAQSPLTPQFKMSFSFTELLLAGYFLCMSVCKPLRWLWCCENSSRSAACGKPLLAPTSGLLFPFLPTLTLT